MLSERPDQWAVHLNGALQHLGSAESAWAYAAAHIAPAERVMVRYRTGRIGMVRTGQDLQELVGRLTMDAG